MKHLSKLTPAETLCLKNGPQAPLKDLLKYTFMDLLLKQVLVLEEVQRQPNPRDPVRIYKYATTGKNFESYRSKRHERVFTSPFQNDRALRILFRNMVKVGYQNAGSANDYYAGLIRNPDLKKAFTTSLYQKIFGGFSYTQEGTEHKNEIQQEMAELEKIVPDVVANDKKRGLEILKAIGGNVFLLQGLDFSLSGEIDKVLLEEIYQSKATSGCGSGCWSSFDNYSTTFDSACSSDWGSGGDGGSGCSGCSGGCSGCGGD